MRAMILAAGRGERMGALTTEVPKPLLRVGDRYLIDYAIASLQRAGITEIVINVSYHGEQIKKALGDGQKYGVAISYSEEKERLETGGGIFQALPLLGDQPFVVMSSDIITDYPVEKLFQHADSLAHLVLVDNPSFHLKGDFGLQEGLLCMHAKKSFTFASLGVYNPALFKDCQPGRFPLNQLLFPAIQLGLLTGEHYLGTWFNVGTPEELALASQHINTINI